MEMNMKWDKWTTQKKDFVQSLSVITNSKTTSTSEVWLLIPKPPILVIFEITDHTLRSMKYG
jgi:hypothetical protein